MFEHLRRDAARYASLGGWYANAGFWITAVYRLGMWAASLRHRALRIPAWAVYRVLKLPLQIFTVDIWAGEGSRGAQIGPGLCLIHPRNVMIGSGVEIGDNCLIFHDVTIGTGPRPGHPRIGRNVDVYVGARLLGGITIGDDCMIGANCVVTRDVPRSSVVSTPPAKIIPRGLSIVARSADEKAALPASESRPQN
jgi:serine O-acetyltransferase